MRRQSHASSSLSIAFVFITCIILLLLAGLLLKAFLLIQDSTFDGNHQYIVEVDENRQKGMLIAYNPATPSVVSVVVQGARNGDLGNTLDVPVDAFVQMPLTQDVASLTRDMLFHTQKESGITIFDKIRLFFFVNSLKQTDFHQQNLTLPVDATVTEKLLPSLFLDNTLYFDNESIAVLNATGESGVGSHVAHLLTTIGMNVISVTTADTVQEASTMLAYQPATYTVHRIERFFHITAGKATDPTHIADITLTIGKKSLPQVQ